MRNSQMWVKAKAKVSMERAWVTLDGRVSVVDRVDLKKRQALWSKDNKWLLPKIGLKG